MQNLHNIFGIPNVQQQFNQQQQQQQQQQAHMVAQMQQQQRPMMQAQAQAPAAKGLADAPIANPNANAKDLYAVENALKKDYDPEKREWIESNIKIQIERKPFAEGAMRAAYRMKIIDGMDVHGKDRFFVLKLSKDPNEPTRQYYKDVETQMESRKWAMEYNKLGVPKQVDFIPAYVVILTDRPMKPTCTMERHVEGEYVKYNDNWSWCDEKRNTPQAFSHYTWEASGNKLLICDLQGVGDCWTDPQIHTTDGRGFGKGNAGLQGVRQFMKQHKCNGICRALKLQSVTGRVKHGDVGTQWGAALKKRSGALAQQKRAAAAEKKPEPAAALVGVGLSIDGGYASGVLLPLIVLNVKANSSAAKSGKIQRGDFILQIDDCPVQGASVSAVKKLIQGAPGTSVTVHLMRGIKTFSVTLPREAAAPTTVANDKKRKVHDRVQEMMTGKGHADANISLDDHGQQPAPKIHKLPTPPRDNAVDKENVDNIKGDGAPGLGPQKPHQGLFNMNGLFGLSNQPPPLQRQGSGKEGFFV